MPAPRCTGAGAGSAGGGGGGGATSFDAAGNLLPAGITRPVPHSLGPTAAQLLSEMAGQLGRLTALAREVEGLKVGGGGRAGGRAAGKGGGCKGGATMHS